MEYLIVAIICISLIIEQGPTLYVNDPTTLKRVESFSTSLDENSFKLGNSIIRGSIIFSHSKYVNPQPIDTMSKHTVYVYVCEENPKQRIAVKYVNKRDSEIHAINKLHTYNLSQCNIINAKIVTNKMGRIYEKLIIMPYLKYNLYEYYHKVISIHGVFPEAILVHIMLQITMTLSSISEQGLFYLDIKPENILVDDNLLAADDISSAGSVAKLSAYLCDLGALIFPDTDTRAIEYTIRSPKLNEDQLVEKDMIWYIGYVYLRLYFHISELRILTIVGNIINASIELQYNTLIDNFQKRVDANVFYTISKTLPLDKNQRINFEELIDLLKELTAAFNVSSEYTIESVSSRSDTQQSN